MLQRHAADCQRSQQDAQEYFDRSLLKELKWTAKEAVTPVKNQGWSISWRAYSTTSSHESARFVDMDVEVMFGEKQLDDRVMANFACADGTMNDEAAYSAKDAL